MNSPYVAALSQTRLSESIDKRQQYRTETLDPSPMSSETDYQSAHPQLSGIKLKSMQPTETPHVGSGNRDQ